MKPSDQVPGQHIAVLFTHEDRAIHFAAGADEGNADLADALVAAIDPDDHLETHRWLAADLTGRADVRLKG